MDGLFGPGIGAAWRRVMTEPWLDETGPEHIRLLLRPSRAAWGFGTAGVAAVLGAAGMAMFGANPMPMLAIGAALIAAFRWGPARGEAVMVGGEVRQGEAVRPRAAYAGLRPWTERGLIPMLNAAPLGPASPGPGRSMLLRGWVLLEPRDGSAAIPLLAVSGRPANAQDLAALSRRFNMPVLPEQRR
jgi:hypothetical protein